MREVNEGKLLTIAIPTYEYAEGVERILMALGPIPPSCEVLISDDSRTSEVRELVAKWCLPESGSVVYHLNSPSIGAAENWNSLLRRASGSYCLLLHHDEFPLKTDFICRLLAHIESNASFDVALLDLVLVSQEGRMRRHLQPFIRRAVARYCPDYLYRRNVIGPTGAMLVRTRLYGSFDQNLCWLVDVDAYVRILRVATNVCFFSDVSVGSLQGRNDSITASLKGKIDTIEESEARYLQRSRGKSSIWISGLANKGVIARMLFIGEFFLWGVVRVSARVLSVFAPVDIKASEIPDVLSRIGLKRL